MKRREYTGESNVRCFQVCLDKFTSGKGRLTNFNDDERENEALLFVFQFPNNLQSDKPELTCLGYNLLS